MSLTFCNCHNQPSTTSRGRHNQPSTTTKGTHNNAHRKYHSSVEASSRYPSDICLIVKLFTANTHSNLFWFQLHRGPVHVLPSMCHTLCTVAVADNTLIYLDSSTKHYSTSFISHAQRPLQTLKKKLQRCYGLTWHGKAFLMYEKIYINQKKKQSQFDDSYTIYII